MADGTSGRLEHPPQVRAGGLVERLGPPLKIVGAALLGGLAWLVALLVVRLIRAHWAAIVVSFDLFWVRILALALLAALTLGFHLLRRRSRRLYAVIEIGAGLAVGWHGFGRLREEPFPAAVTIVGAVYVLIRAFDNYSKRPPARGQE